MMDYQKEILDCGCGRHHSCQVQEIQIGTDVLGQIPILLAPYEHILLVYDHNTYQVCGRQVETLLRASHNQLNVVLYPDAGLLVPNEESIRQLEQGIRPTTQVIVGVGAGVINDLCKYVSHCHGLPYMIVATAPSMDGYASQGSALMLKNMKVTYPAGGPRWIVAELEVLCNAPMKMIRSGVGDILGKWSSLNDWQLGHLVIGEPLCPMVYNMVWQQVIQCMADVPLIVKRDPTAIRHLMEQLIQMGVAMSYMGNTRPASGSEHHLSHFYEVTGLLQGKPYFPHGIDVGYSAVVTSGLRLLLADASPLDFANRHQQEEWEKQIHRVYGSAAQGVLDLQRQVGFYAESHRLDSIREHWGEIRELLLSGPTPGQLLARLTQAGFDMEEFWRLYTPEMVEESILYAKDLKDRYTLLWLLQDTGMLERLAARYVREAGQPPYYVLAAGGTQ